jgi:hypothetical protein
MISIIYPYYDNKEMLSYQLKLWKGLPPTVLDSTEWILVDDCSKEPLNVDGQGLNLKTFYILDDIPWNVSGAKNLGAHNAQSDWVLISDMDRVIPAATLYKCLSITEKNPRRFFIFKETDWKGDWSRGFHQGTVFLRKQDYWAVKGYDEDFSGHYGHEDGHFMRKLASIGLVRTLLDESIQRWDRGPISDACSPPESYGDKHYNGPLSNAKGSSIPEKLDVLRFQWRAGASWTR